MSVSFIVIIIICTLVLLGLAVLAGGIFIIMKSSERDGVSTARQGWINRRSDKDQEGW